MPVLLGTSGWQYRHWRGRLYPEGLGAPRWLAYYAERFATVEVDSSFYRLPSVEAVGRWAAAVPEDFCFAAKASRYLTHVRRLGDPAEPVGRLLERLAPLGGHRGPVLIQLPPTLRPELGRLAETLAAFGPGVRVAVEPRHPDWFTQATYDLLAEHGAALCLTDTAGRRSPLERTADWAYVRFHAGRASPAGCYGPTALASWAERLAERWPPEADVYAYFNNDGHGCAPRDARRFAAALARAGLAATRVPGPRETPVG